MRVPRSVPAARAAVLLSALAVATAGCVPEAPSAGSPPRATGTPSITTSAAPGPASTAPSTASSTVESGDPPSGTGSTAPAPPAPGPVPSGTSAPRPGGTGPTDGTVVDFENGSLDPLGLEDKGNPMEVVQDPAEQDSALRITWSRAERAEWTLPTVDAGSEHCYSLSMFFPTSHRVPTQIITQWHERPDRDKGEDWRIPPIYVSPTEDGSIRMTGAWTKAEVNSTSEIRQYDGDDHDAESGEWSADLGPMTQGQWMHYDFHIRWSYRSDGLVEVFRDGQPVFTRSGPNTYNDESGNYWKAGIYNGNRSLSGEYVIYHDDVRQSPAGQACGG